jgi:hypothetical protein
MNAEEIADTISEMDLEPMIKSQVAWDFANALDNYAHPHEGYNAHEFVARATGR